MALKVVKDYNEELLVAVKAVADNMGYDVRSYSGRGMYGKRCLGVTGSIDLFQFGAYVHEEIISRGFDVSIDEMGGARTDSMGLDIVVYWPRVEVTGSDYDEDEENREDED